MKQQQGFSLIELAVVVLIVTILTIIAIPIYKGVEQKARRTQAVNALETLASREEGYFSRYNTYASDMTALGYQVPSDVTTTGGYYAVSATSATPNTYTLTAVPQAAGSQDQDKCGNFVLDSFGRETVTGSAGVEDCWH